MVDIQLRDGSITHDPRLDRLVEFDERSRNYAAVDALDAEAERRGPRSYTWRMHARLDQGQEGACVGFAHTHELVARPKELTTFTPQDVGGTFARETVYWGAQRRDPWAGGAYPGASPFYEGTSVLAGAQVLHDLGYYVEYRWAFGEEDLAQTIGYLGPAVIGINWYEGMFDTNQHGFIEPTGRVMGGHAILTNVMRVKTRTRTHEWYELTNSWGRGWGNDGRCKLSREHMDRLLREDGEALIPVIRGMPQEGTP